jgi:hypothetical protein
MAELIADCADIPAGLRAARQQVHRQADARTWSVDEASRSRIEQWDEYV